MEFFIPFPGLRSKNLFYIIFLILTKEFKIHFQNRKWNYPIRKWNFFCTSRPLIRKLLLQVVSHFLQGVLNWFSKQGIEWSKNFSQKICFYFNKEIQIDFQQEIELFEQEMELFFQIQGLWSNIHFNKCFLFSPRSSKLIFKKENGIVQPGNWINSPSSWPLIQNILLQFFFSYLPRSLNQKLYWYTFSSVHLFWHILT